MHAHWLFLLVLLTAAHLPALTEEMVSVKPEETDELLANPGIGWETFHVTKARDKSLPAWLPSTVHYARWGWGKFEPRPGKIDTAFLDKQLQDSHDAEQQLAFRVMCCSTSKSDPYFPAWLKDVGGRIVVAQHDGDFPVPDLDDAVVLERHLDFIKRLGERYDGHPEIDHVDLGSVGWWGEWHMSRSATIGMPKIENQQKIVDAYLAAFKKTPLLMLIGGGKMLTYATQHGCGWRADCLGDLGGFSKNWNHMQKGYPGWMKDAGVQETWKTAPMAWESGWDMRKWVEEKWPVRFIFNYALAVHGSYLNNKSAPLPEGAENKVEVERFVRRLGYRLVLRELKHPGSVTAGKDAAFSMKWQNVGSAPCYKPYRVAYRFAGPNGVEKIVASKVTVNKWLPGSVELFTEEFFKGNWELPNGEVVDVADSIALPADLAAGEYALAVAVVGVDSLQPAIRLAIKGRGTDGWYTLSKVRVEK
ncbi:MAG TPA: DUF4832 domain-containing protein [Planctomycetota bacterium]|jgi:hypothetical protein